jgi:DNA-binding transcriptional ArsR family regulator
MSDEITAHRLAALGHPLRLRLYRLLVRAGPDGVTVGQLQARLDLPGSTLSHHLKALDGAGLIRRRRAGTTLHCIADFSVMRGLVDTLAADCCADAPATGADLGDAE